jgi:hypothetical protein
MDIQFSIRDNKLPASCLANSYTIDTEVDESVLLATELPWKDA